MKINLQGKFTAEQHSRQGHAYGHYQHWNCISETSDCLADYPVSIQISDPVPVEPYDLSKKIDRTNSSLLRCHFEVTDPKGKKGLTSLFLFTSKISKSLCETWRMPSHSDTRVATDARFKTVISTSLRDSNQGCGRNLHAVICLFI